MLEILEWWNLVFVLPFLAGLLYLGLLCVGLVGEHEVDADIDHDISIDVDHDADVGGDLDHGIEHSTEVGHDHDGEHGAFVKALGFLGVGRVPISLVLMSFCFLWGASGYLGNQFFKDVFRHPAFFFWPSLGLALASSVFGTRWLARGLTRIMPSTETYATLPEDLVGQTAEALFLVTSQFGRARLRDRYHNIQDVSVRLADGGDSIPAGSRVVLLRYDATEQAYVVRQDALSSQRLVEAV